MGKAGPGTPRIDALADEGAGFSNAISPVPLTLPAHASLIHRTAASEPHRARQRSGYRLPEVETTLAEALAEAGFVTGAFIGAEVLDARYGLDQGFATYDDEIADPGASPFLYYPERAGEEVVAAATRWLDASGGRARLCLGPPLRPAHAVPSSRARALALLLALRRRDRLCRS